MLCEGVRWASTLFVLLSSLVVSPVLADSVLVHAYPTDRLLILRFSPKSAAPPRSDAEILDGAESGLAGRAHLEVSSAEGSGIDVGEADGCPLEHRFRCWTSIATRDPLTRYLLVLSVQPRGEDSWIWTPLLFDLARSRGLETQSLDPDAIERALHESAVRLAPRQVTAGEPTKPHFERIFSDLQGLFEANGHAGAFAALEISAEPSPYRVGLDDEVPVEVPRETRMRLERIAPGEHTVVARGASDTKSIRLQIGPGEIAELSLGLESDSGPHPLSIAVVYGGAALTLAGAALALGSRLSRQDPEDEVRVTVDAPPFSSEGASIPLVVGIGLASGGATMALSTVLFSPDPDPPWWQLALGVAVGGTTSALLYNLSAR